MNVQTGSKKGGTAMDEDTQPTESQAPTNENGQDGFKRPVDWSEGTIIVNGQPLTVLFPEDQ